MFLLYGNLVVVHEPVSLQEDLASEQWKEAMDNEYFANEEQNMAPCTSKGRMSLTANGFIKSRKRQMELLTG